MRALLTPERLLSGLEAIAKSVSTRPSALAVLGLGSCGQDRARLDPYSDLDFFVIVQADAKQDWIANLDWLTTGSPLVFAHKNTPDGWKTLDRDGVFCEFAVFHPEELAHIPFQSGRVVWARDGFDTACLIPRSERTEIDVNYLGIEAMTNILIGLKRLLRGEVLAARQAICVHGADNVCALLAGDERADPFNPWRRLETSNPVMAAKMTAALNHPSLAASAAALLALIGETMTVPEALNAEILAHLDAYHAR